VKYTQCSVDPLGHRPIIRAIIGIAVISRVDDVSCRRQLMEVDVLLLANKRLTVAQSPADKSDVGRIPWFVDGR